MKFFDLRKFSKNLIWTQAGIQVFDDANILKN